MKTFENVESVAEKGKSDEVLNKFIELYLQREKLRVQFIAGLAEEEFFEESAFAGWLAELQVKDDFAVPEITEADVEYFRRANYSMFRAGAYPPMEIYLDAVVKGDAEQEQEYKDLCAAVKERFPK